MSLKDLHQAQRDACEVIVRERTRLIERHLIGAVEQIEGRVPTNNEVAAHGQRLLHYDGKEVYLWKGTPIIEVAKDALKMVDGKMSFKIRSVFRNEE